MEPSAKPIERLLRHSDLAIALLLLVITAMIVMPLRPLLIDLLLTLNLAGSVVILLMTMYNTDPLEFSSFPSLLLVTTLFRLALNVAITRLILLTGDAGRVVSAFGSFVVGGSYIVGFVIFLILVIVQFIVITNGTSRIAEVAARFTLDAMPGKQMAIDADLNAGIITEEVARQRRAHIERQADFFGAMDGASKFVRGDAMAGILITLTNLLGGILVGTVSRRMPILQALQTYALLTVGAGLMVQIPALLVSAASGIIVTRTAAISNLGSDITAQLLSQPRAIAIASGIVGALGLLPGFPKLAFLSASGLLALLAFLLRQPPEAPAEAEAPPPADLGSPEAIRQLLDVDPMELEIGYGLIPLVDPEQQGDLIQRIVLIRRQIASDLGLLVPPIRVRDNTRLGANQYVISIRGVEVARGEVTPGAYLAIKADPQAPPLEGRAVREPAFGLEAYWIPEALRPEAERLGYGVVDASSALATHLSEVIRTHAAQLLTRQEVANLIERVKERNRAVVEELIPNLLTVGDVQKVLQNLLREQVPIRDMVTILETLADHARTVRDPDVLTELTRQALGRTISQRFWDDKGRLPALVLDPALERDLLAQVGEGGLADPAFLMRVQEEIAAAWERAAMRGHQAVLTCSSKVRLPLRRLLERRLARLPVLAYEEIVGVELLRLEVVSLSHES